MSLTELQREVRKRERQTARKLDSLRRMRARVASRLTAIDAEIARHGGTVRKLGRTGRIRPQNDANLADSLVKLLKNTTMNVTTITSAVQKAGYKTTSPNFRTIVNQTLIKDSRFKRVGRGRYTVK